MRRDTGFPDQDAQSDFGRARRSRAVSRLAARLRREPGDVDVILPFDEVVAALGRSGERRLGLQPVALDAIVGTVDRGREFDRRFRPTSRRVRQRWERIARAVRRGESMPPVELYRVGGMHFVSDGHHRVSVARALGHDVIDAYVTEIRTQVPAGDEIRLSDLALKSHERLFLERVPLDRGQRQRIALAHGSSYATLAEAVEAWGFRLMQERREYLTRREVAQAWFAEEYLPVVEMLREARLSGSNSDADAYLKLTALRYLFLRTHAWDEEVVERLREELRRPPGAGEDTGVHRLRGGLGT